MKSEKFKKKKTCPPPSKAQLLFLKDYICVVVYFFKLHSSKSVSYGSFKLSAWLLSFTEKTTVSQLTPPSRI